MNILKVRQLNKKESENIVIDQISHFFRITSVFNLVSRPMNHQSIEVEEELFAILKENQNLHPVVIEGLVRSLTNTTARIIPEIFEYMLGKFHAYCSKHNMLGWATGNLIGFYLNVNHQKFQKDLLKIVENREYGIARQMIILNLYKLKMPELEKNLVPLIYDDEVSVQVISCLYRMKSKLVRKESKFLLGHPNKNIRKRTLNYLK